MAQSLAVFRVNQLGQVCVRTKDSSMPSSCSQCREPSSAPAAAPAVFIFRPYLLGRLDTASAKPTTSFAHMAKLFD
jgi:hypothetical protein